MRNDKQNCLKNENPQTLSLMSFDTQMLADNKIAKLRDKQPRKQRAKLF